ncbi:MAG: XRE family transcriptional regulator [Firmicutes bacterium HGW-Firmicutes-15]|nr:MAG: XRE family transcriptional regulator [Firmicutes bacterium HGW-Firmicutes-15]
MVRAIKRYRELKGWSQSCLARKSGVSQTYISELEAGKWTPNLSILRKLASALGVPVSALLDDEYEGDDEDYISGNSKRIQLQAI